MLAYLYIRVSTDEQAIKGYSQRNQAERLLRYCELNHIGIAGKVFEDHSAKTFNRPEWNILYANLKLAKKAETIVLFTHWDRFSRNITDAYHMIDRLKQFGVMVQAIEQPVDLSIPESKIMLAMYLATSEVENDRRSANVRMGMRRARQEGRWANKAPIGYRNRISAAGQKYIGLYEPKASILRLAFLTIAQQGVSISSAYAQTQDSGLKCSRSHFYTLLRNPIYCGKISLPESEGTKKTLINGNHEGLISVALFEQVQKLIHKDKAKPTISRGTINEALILRGVLLCPLCNKVLTGSASKGRSKRYYYYHCALGCHYRARAELVNGLFTRNLNNLKAKGVFIALFEHIYRESYYDYFKENKARKAQINIASAKLIERALQAQQLFSRGEIDYEDYILIRDNCKSSLGNYTNSLQELILESFSIPHSSEKMLLLNNIGLFYEQSKPDIKRQVADLMFQQKVVLKLNDFEDMFADPVKIIFGLKGTVLKNTCHAHEDDYQNMLNAVYLDMLKNEGKMVRENGPKIVNFMQKLVFIGFCAKNQSL